ncbi:hypothetical protein ACQRIU_001325 [Beauveria bassiana]
MAVETGGTSETSLKRKATSEYFYLEIEGHYECAVRQKAALHISDKIEPGFWSWTDQFSEVCDILGLPNLARLSLDVTAQLDHAEKRWRIATQNWERMSRAEIKVARTQLGQDVQVSLGDLRRLCLDQSDAELMTAEVRPSENSVPDHDSSSQNVEYAGEAGSVASDEGSLFMPIQPSVDSGYVSNVGSQQMHGSTLAAPLSGAFVVPRASSSRSNVQRDPAAAAGETEDDGSSVLEAAELKRTHDQLLSYQSVRGLDALASAASQACPSHHDGAAGNRHLPVLDSPSDEVAAEIEETPGRGVFATASSRTAYNDTRDNDESNAPNDFSGLISGESVHVANTQGSPPAGKDGTNIASDVDSQTWNFSLNDPTLEDPQSWMASFDSMTNEEDMQSLFNDIL